MDRTSFSKKYTAWITVFGCLYIFIYSFTPTGWKDADAKTVLGFVLGIMLGTAITWAIGTSKTSSDKTNFEQEKIKNETTA